MEFGFSHIVGVGDHLDIGHGMVLDALSRDADTSAILLDIRSIRDGRLFLSAARAAARLRPVVAICAGLRRVSPDGAANLSFEAAMRRAGVLCVNRLEDLLAAAETLSRARPVRCDTLAIVSNATGPARLATDSALRAGLELYQDESLTLEVAPADLASTAFAMAARSDVGGVLVLHAPLGSQDEATINSLIGKHPEQRAPVLVCVMGETTGAIAPQHPGPCRVRGVRNTRPSGERVRAPGAGPPQPRRRSRTARQNRADRRPGRCMGADNFRQSPRFRSPGSDPGRIAGCVGRVWRCGSADALRRRSGGCRPGRRVAGLSRHGQAARGLRSGRPSPWRPGARPAQCRRGRRRRTASGRG